MIFAVLTIFIYQFLLYLVHVIEGGCKHVTLRGFCARGVVVKIEGFRSEMLLLY